MSAASGSLEFERAPHLFRRHWGWLLGFAIVQIVAGAFAIALPALASLVAVAVFGWVMIVAAIFQIAHAIRVRQWPGFALQLLGGLLYGGAGVLALLYPVPSLFGLTLFVGALLLAEGILRVVLAWRVRVQGDWGQEGWGWFLAAGIASIVLGGMLLVGWPATALWALGLLMGIDLIFGGSTNVAVALLCRKRQNEPRRGSHSNRATAAA
jgi:uncharacterized membrane protein HdeD (DUF308 family)